MCSVQHIQETHSDLYFFKLNTVFRCMLKSVLCMHIVAGANHLFSSFLILWNYYTYIVNLVKHAFGNKHSASNANLTLKERFVM